MLLFLLQTLLWIEGGTVWPYEYGTRREERSGKLVSRKMYNESGDLVNETTNTYTSIDYPEIQAVSCKYKKVAKPERCNKFNT